MAVLVATKPLVLRKGAPLEAPLTQRGMLKAGTVVVVLRRQTLPDGTVRALVARQGHRHKDGWVSWVTDDGRSGLASRATAFTDRMKEMAAAMAMPAGARSAAETERARRIKRRLKRGEADRLSSARVRNLNDEGTHDAQQEARAGGQGN